MAFSVSGSNATQTGSDLTGLGANIDALADIQQGYQRVLTSGETLTVQGTFVDETGEFYLILDNARFGTTGTGSITIGKREVVSGKPLYSKGGFLVVKASVDFASGHISYDFSNDAGTSTTGSLNLYDTNILFYTRPANGRVNQFVSNLAGSNVRVVKQNTSAGSIINLRFQSGAVVDDNIIQGIKQFEFHGDPASFTRNKFIDTSGFIAYSNGTLVKLNNIDFITNAFNDVGITNNGGLYYIDTYQNGGEMAESVINAAQTGAFANLGIIVNTNPALHGVHWGKSHTESLQDSGGITVPAKVWIKDVLNNEYIPTVTNGQYSATVRLKRATSTGYNVPTYENHYPIKKVIYKYGYLPQINTYNTYDEFIGIGVITPSTNLLISDNSITEGNKTSVDALTSSTTPQQFYDLSCAFAEDNIEALHTAGALFVSRSGNTIDAGSYNVNFTTTGVDAFSFDGATITVKGTSYAGGLITTGNINIEVGVDVAGATFNGAVTMGAGRDLTNVTVVGGLTFNDNIVASYSMLDSNIDALFNDGTGLLTWTQSGSTVGDQSDAEVSVIAAPTPSSFTLTATAGDVWAVYDNTDTRVSTGTGNHAINHAGGVDTGTWTVVIHRLGHTAERISWVSDDGSANTYTTDPSQLLRPEGGAAYSGGSTAGVVTSRNGNDRVQVNVPNSATSPQVVVDAQQDFLHTVAGLDFIFGTGIQSAPVWGILNGTAFMLSIEGFQYDSITGTTPESSVSGVLISSATHSNVVLTNGGTSFSASGSVDPIELAQQVWDYLQNNPTISGSMKDALQTTRDHAKATDSQTQPA